MGQKRWVSKEKAETPTPSDSRNTDNLFTWDDGPALSEWNFTPTTQTTEENLPVFEESPAHGGGRVL
jgi:hypothetical protein